MLAWFALGSLAVAAFAIRLFPVLRWEAIIHDLDPWFNYRATEYLAEHGLLRFLDWLVNLNISCDALCLCWLVSARGDGRQDDRVWYPLGRPVGSTTYPGLMVSAWLGKLAVSALGFPVSIKCVSGRPAR